MASEVTILHVDDDAAFLDITKEHLTRQHSEFEVETATDTDAALEHFRTNRVDIIISDYDMPGCNGIDFLERVRAHCTDTPFILFTGKGSEAVASQAISAGVTDYIQKQVGTEQYELLANRIHNAVETRQLAQSVQRKNRRLEQLLEIVPSCVIEVAPDGEILYANKYAEAVLGIDPQDAVGQTFPQATWELQTLDRVPLLTDQQPHIQVVRADGAIQDSRFVLQRRDGTEHILSTNGAPLYDDTGDIDRIVLSLHDITTEQRSVESMRRRKEALQDAYPIIAREPASVLEQIDELLAVAKRAVGTTYATFGQVDGDELIFKAVAVPGDGGRGPGDSSQLDTLPPCQQVVETDTGIMLDNIEREAPKLVTPQHSMTRHLGVPVTVDNETYGTLCFYDTDTVEGSFTDWQQTFVDILADWIGAELERTPSRDLTLQ